MKHLAARILALGLAVCPLPLTAETCDPLGTVGTDGTGAPSKYRVGGSYLATEIGQIPTDATIKVVPDSGPYRYVTLHTRVNGGIWSTAYQGPRTEFPGTDPVFESCRSQKNCTHIIFAVNGAHEKYETLVSSARIERCVQGGGLVLDTTWTAPKSGWKIDLPHDWSRDVTDDPNGGTGLFIDPTNNIVVSVTTLDHGRDYTPDRLIPLMQDNMFKAAHKTHDQPVNLAGISGTLHRYELVSDGTPYVAMASYLPFSDTRMYVVWGMVPTAMADQRGNDAVAIMNTFRTISVPPAMAGPLSLAMLAVGDSPAVGKQPGAGRAGFSTRLARLHVAGGIVGTDRTGEITVTLNDLSGGATVFRQTYPIADQPVDRAIMLDAVIERPSAGWSAGTYRLVVSHDGTELGSRMFILEAQQ